jgi:hypothetical protein
MGLPTILPTSNTYNSEDCRLWAYQRFGIWPMAFLTLRSLVSLVQTIDFRSLSLLVDFGGTFVCPFDGGLWIHLTLNVAFCQKVC